MITKNAFWLKWTCVTFLVFSLFLAKIDEPACLVCTSVYWAIAVLLMTNKMDKERFLLKFATVVALLTLAFPIVLHLTFANSDAVAGFFRSEAADDSAYTFQRACQEVLKIKECVTSMVAEKDVRQMNKTFVWHFFIPGLVCSLYLLFLVFWKLPAELIARLRSRGLHNMPKGM